MSYRVMARKWRPEVFEDVVAQDHIVRTLQNAIRSGRVAQAYLFSGPRGTGKTTTARLLAKALNCEKGTTPDPCGECAACKAVAGGKSMDVLEIDGASNRGIDEIRQLREEVGYAASSGRYKVYIIDEVHMLTPEAFNALLKTLEEPPPHVVFVFATTEPFKVPETILSRCQRYSFRRIPAERIVAHLRTIAPEEGIDVEEEALFLIARKADGAMRDAQSLLDQASSFSEGTITEASIRDLLGLISRDVYFDLTRAVLDGDGAAALNAVSCAMEEGGDVGEFTEGLMEHFRHLLVARVSESMQGEDLSEADRERYADLAARFQEDDLLRMLQAVADLELNLGRVSEPRFWLELTAMKLVKMPSTVLLKDLLGRLEHLEGLLRAAGGERGNLSRPDVDNAEMRPAARPSHPGRTPASGRREVAPAVEEIEPPEALEAPSDPGPGVAKPPPRFEGELTLEAIRSFWDSLIQAVKARKISVGTFLAEGWPRALDGRQLTVAFKRSGMFHVNQVNRNRETVEAAAAEMFGTPLRVVCEVEQNEESEAEPEDRDSPEADARVQLALRIFEGEVIRR